MTISSNQMAGNWHIWQFNLTFMSMSRLTSPWTHHTLSYNGCMDLVHLQKCKFLINAGIPSPFFQQYLPDSKVTLLARVFSWVLYMWFNWLICCLWIFINLFWKKDWNCLQLCTLRQWKLTGCFHRPFRLTNQQCTPTNVNKLQVYCTTDEVHDFGVLCTVFLVTSYDLPFTLLFIVWKYTCTEFDKIQPSELCSIST